MTDRIARAGSARRRPLGPVLAGLAVLSLTWLVLAGTQVAPALPETAQASARGPCLLPAAEMRRRHMDRLLEARIQAVRAGQRDPAWSMEACVGCHVVSDAAGRPVDQTDARHFCRSCHDQAAVAIDCFSCHRATPHGTTTVAGQTGPDHAGDRPAVPPGERS